MEEQLRKLVYHLVIQTDHLFTDNENFQLLRKRIEATFTVLAQALYLEEHIPVPTGLDQVAKAFHLGQYGESLPTSSTMDSDTESESKNDSNFGNGFVQEEEERSIN